MRKLFSTICLAASLAGCKGGGNIDFYSYRKVNLSIAVE